MKKIVAVLAIFVLFLCPLQAFAMSGNATGDDNQAGTIKLEGGPTYQHTGWLIYLVDANSGNQVSNTRVYYCYDKPTEYYICYPKTRFGGSIDWKSGTVGTRWNFAPFDNDGNGYGDDLKKWMLTMEDDKYRIVALCEEEFGVASTQKVIDGDYTVVYEAVFWGQMYTDAGASGIYLCATAYGWADTQYTMLGMEKGSKWIGRYTNDIYPNCVRLQYPQFGLSPADGKLTNAAIMSSGSGFGTINSKDGGEPEAEIVTSTKKLYGIKNYSAEYDISEGIPAGEKVTNEYEADAFYATSFCFSKKN